LTLGLPNTSIGAERSPKAFREVRSKMNHPVLREYNARKDLENLYDLGEVAYAEDYARIGRSAKAGMDRERRVVAAVTLLGKVFPGLRDASKGFVWEDEGRIVSVVLLARVGLAGDRWSIETVATHPDYRRRGLARRLVEQAIDSIRDRSGAVCTLKVRAENAPAYALYCDLGFVHYDSTAHLKLDEVRGTIAPRMNGYAVREATPTEWFGSWEARFGLALRETPEAVQRILPVSPFQYRRPAFARFLAPAVIRLSGRRIDHFLVEDRDRLVATLAVDADAAGEGNHDLRVCVDPEHAPALAAALVDKGLRGLAGFAALPVLAETRASNRIVIRAFEDRGFETISTWHWLGLRLDA